MWITHTQPWGLGGVSNGSGVTLGITPSRIRNRLGGVSNGSGVTPLNLMHQ